MSQWPDLEHDYVPQVKSTHPDWALDGMSLLPLFDDPTLSVRAKPIGHATGQAGDAFGGLPQQSGQPDWLANVGPCNPGSFLRLGLCSAHS